MFLLFFPFSFLGGGFRLVTLIFTNPVKRISFVKICNHSGVLRRGPMLFRENLENSDVKQERWQSECAFNVKPCVGNVVCLSPGVAVVLGLGASWVSAL